MMTWCSDRLASWWHRDISGVAFWISVSKSSSHQLSRLWKKKSHLNLNSSDLPSLLDYLDSLLRGTVEEPEKCAFRAWSDNIKFWNGHLRVLCSYPQTVASSKAVIIEDGDKHTSTPFYLHQLLWDCCPRIWELGRSKAETRCDWHRCYALPPNWGGNPYDWQRCAQTIQNEVVNSWSLSTHYPSLAIVPRFTAEKGTEAWHHTHPSIQACPTGNGRCIHPKTWGLQAKWPTFCPHPCGHSKANAKPMPMDAYGKRCQRMEELTMPDQAAVPYP